MHAMPDAVLVVDRGGQVIFSNHGAKSFFEIYPPEKALKDILGARLLAEQATALHELTLLGKGVSSLSIVPMAHDGLKLVVIRPETLPLKKDQAARLRPARHLARMLAHEVKNPLSSIQGAAQLLVKSSLEKDDRELAALIDREAQRVLRLVGRADVLNDAPYHEFCSVNIHEVLDAACAGFSRRVKIDAQYDPSLPEIEGHTDLLTQVFANLLKNAVEAGARGVILRSHYGIAPKINAQTGLKMPICVTVEDDGSGMDAQTQSRLFEPYFTTKPEGEGLGLAVVSKIVEDHGAVIDVSSMPGRTVFTISFPRGAA